MILVRLVSLALVSGLLVAAGPTAAVVGNGNRAVAQDDECAYTGTPFRPTTLSIPGTVKRATVLALGRDRNNVPKAPPLSDSGKRQFAWNKGDRRPGTQAAVVKMNAHTYPDGSAMGNRLLNELYIGDVIIVRGENGQKLCYDVVDRAQVTAKKRVRTYYRNAGPPRLGIVVCSGKRSAGGNWSHRTFWYAAPRQALDKAEPLN